MGVMTTPETTNNKIGAFPEELITKKQLSKRLKVCVRMVELQTNKGIIPNIRIGSSVRYHWQDVLTALKNNQSAA
jgi:hypothetical protein